MALWKPVEEVEVQPAVASILLTVSQQKFMKAQTPPGADGHQAGHLVEREACPRTSAVVQVPAASSLAYYYIEGDYWPWGASGNWMGRRIAVTTHAMAVQLVLNGTMYGQQKLRMTQTGPAGQQVFSISNGQVRTIQIPADTTLTLTAAQTFVPDRVIHNGDIRNLSVLVAIDK